MAGSIWRSIWLARRSGESRPSCPLAARCRRGPSRLASPCGKTPAAAEVVEAPTDPANVAMRAVFQRVGWELAGSLTEYEREWVMYRITRPQWQARAAG